MGLFSGGGGFNPVKTVTQRASRVFRPEDIVPSLGRAIRPQDVVPSVKRLADPKNHDEFFDERLQALKDWIRRRGEALVMEPPHLQLINPLGVSGEPIVYINGLNTLEAEARQDGEYMSRALRRPVQLLYNPSNASQRGELHGGFIEDGIEALFDSVYVAPMPQHNRTTRQLNHLLYYSEERISLVTHSQGCLIARNALHTVEMLGEKSRVQKNLAWIAAGSPVSRRTLRFKPARFRDLLIPGDLVGQVLGGKFGAKWHQANRRRHEFVHEDIRDPRTGRVKEPFKNRIANDIDYLAVIEVDTNREILWPAGSFSLAPQQRKFGRKPVLVNQTDHELHVTFMHQVRETDQLWFFDGVERTATVPPRSRLTMSFVTQLLRIRAQAGERRWNFFDPPMRLAPAEGFLTTAATPDFEISFSAQRPPDKVLECFGKEKSHTDDDTVWHWYDVTKDSAFRRGGPKTEFFEEAMVFPQGLEKTPFASANELFQSHFGYFRSWPESKSVWFLPKDGTGDVWRHDPPAGWFREGRIGVYQPSPGPAFGSDDLDEFPDPELERPGIAMATTSLADSSWSTVFTENGQEQTAFLELRGTQGNYRNGTTLQGQLSDIRYDLRESVNELEISGRWNRDNANGVFNLRVPTNEVSQSGLLSQFRGNWWIGEGLGAPAGTWNGDRADPRVAFCRIRNATSKRIRFAFAWNPQVVNQIQLEPGRHTVVSTADLGEIATARIIFAPGPNQAEREVAATSEIGFAGSDGPEWRTLSTLDPEKMIVSEFVPQGFGGMALRVITQRSSGDPEIFLP